MRETRVDLSELEETVRKLGRLSTAMGETVTGSRYNTYLPEGALGSHRFVEGAELTSAHREMKAHIEEVVRVIDEAIEDFGTKTKTVHGNYQNAEYDAKNGMEALRAGDGE